MFIIRDATDQSPADLDGFGKNIFLELQMFMYEDNTVFFFC